MSPVLFCQRCGAFQVISDCLVEPCARCGGRILHHLHPADRSTAWSPWVEPQDDQRDATILRALGISVEA